MKLPKVLLPIRDLWEVQALLAVLEISRDQTLEAKAITEQDPTITDIEDFTYSMGMYNDMLDVLERCIRTLKERLALYAAYGESFHGRGQRTRNALHALCAYLQNNVRRRADAGRPTGLGGNADEADHD